jgi:hypothetical protein
MKRLGKRHIESKHGELYCERISKDRCRSVHSCLVLEQLLDDEEVYCQLCAKIYREYQDMGMMPP